MPIGYIVRDNTSTREQLRDRLVAEWRLAVPANAQFIDAQPVLIEDKGKDNRFGLRPSTHLYVIWDAWDVLDPQERSEIIMDAYEETHELPDVIRVTVALGLTTNEAQKSGLHYSTG